MVTNMSDQNNWERGVLEKLAVAEHLALGAAIALAILNLAGSFLPLAQRLQATNWR